MKLGKLLLVIMIFISCNRSGYIPADVLQPEQMQEVLWDLMRGDILVQESLKKDSTKNLEKETVKLSDKIFSIHKIDRAKFETSIAFYEKHPGMVKTIFDSLYAIKSRRPLTGTERMKVEVKEHGIPPKNNTKVR